MTKEERIQERLFNVAIHESGHILALLSFHITPYYVELNELGGETKCTYPNDWTKDKDDYVLLSGCVAESISNNTFADLIEQVLAGNIPKGSSSDFSKLTLSDTKLIADMMLHIRDYILNERWFIVLEFASELLEHGKLNRKDISKIADRLCGIDRNIGHIAHFMENRTSLTLDINRFY